ncbi:MAG: ComEC/Rec2 family competence protein [Deltaproteobacteria bacterium]|nr:ComEC/Rec2 family competence protein [Deltaproteobacteria bacterium]
MPSSAPLLIPGLLTALGVVLWPWLQPNPAHTLLALGALALIALAVGERGLGWLATWAAALCLGLTAPGLRAPGPLLDGPVQLRGEVVEVRGGRAILQVSQLGATPLTGPVELSGGGDLRVGDRVSVRGEARPLGREALPGEPDPVRDDLLRGLRSGVRAQSTLVLGAFPGPAPPDPFEHATHRGLLRALALGDRAGLDDDTKALLRRTGTTHLVSVSGLHFVMIAAMASGIVTALIRPLSLLRPQGGLNRLAPLAGLGALLAFGELVGWPIPAVRAGWMTAGVVAGQATARGANPWNLLGLAAGVMVVCEPSAARSVSAWLSFGAVIGMLTVGAKLGRMIPPDLPWLVKGLAGAVTTTLGATAGTLPVSVWIFQELSLTAPLANLVAIPLTSIFATPGALLALGGGGVLPLAIADGACEATILWLRLIDAPVAHPAAGPLGAALIVLACLSARHHGLAGVFALLSLLRLLPAEGLHVTFFAIGQGDAALIQLPGYTALIDAGPPGDDVLRALRRAGIREVDELWVSHPHPDHMGGAKDVVEGLKVGALRITRPPLPDEAAFQDLWRAAALAGTPARGLEVPPGHPALTILHPKPGEHFDEVNDQSITLLLRHGAHSLLFPGDVEAEAEAALITTWDKLGLGPITALKVAHHGSRTSSDPALLARLQPLLAIFSCGVDNRFGHPHPDVVRRYAASLQHRTDRQGTLQLRSDGQTMWRRSHLPGRGFSVWSALPPSTSR